MSDAQDYNLGLGNSAPVCIPLNAGGETFNFGTLKLQVGQTGVNVLDTKDTAQVARMYHWRSITKVLGVAHLSARGSCENVKSSVVVADICIEIRGGEQICIKMRGREQFNDAKCVMQSMMQIATELAALQKKAKQQRAVGAPAHKSIEAVPKKKQTSVRTCDCERIPTYLVSDFQGYHAYISRILYRPFLGLASDSALVGHVYLYRRAIHICLHCHVTLQGITLSGLKARNSILALSGVDQGVAQEAWRCAIGPK